MFKVHAGLAPYDALEISFISSFMYSHCRSYEWRFFNFSKWNISFTKKLYAVKILIAFSNWNYIAGYTLKYRSYIYSFYDSKNHDTIIKIETKYSSGQEKNWCLWPRGLCITFHHRVVTLVIYCTALKAIVPMNYKPKYLHSEDSFYQGSQYIIHYHYNV